MSREPSHPFIPNLPDLSKVDEVHTGWFGGAEMAELPTNKMRPQKVRVRLTAQELVEIAHTKKMLVQRLEEKLALLQQEELKLEGAVKNPAHVIELLRPQLQALTEEQQRVRIEMFAIEKQQGMAARLLRRPRGEHYVNLQKLFFELQEKIVTLNEKMSHPDVVSIQTLQQLAAVRNRIDAVKKDIAYRAHNMPERLVYQDDDAA